ncbi:hypothetical protein [Accumulibacter sp.]|uniref:hypothetical protein n=1 Tax=Accumulibacter sp. TaxID=2053492 RepID=UPI0025D0BE6E|nr:hypothetical protein [Accumulibacter sp.]MCM8594977.1 hypothetical protein [Accumulibacter sp.]MDS4049123.1 hypothetical protein [Accumulibacter sp.]
MARKGIMELRLGSASLIAVPAVHFQSAFARLVNLACADPSARPDAVAVELGPVAAAAARQWLSELGVGPESRTRLPCMLGLAGANRLLRPSARERALELQRETGHALEDLPPQLLYEELGFRGTQVLMLSPTDSIIEAIRCALELGVPLYGVDLDEMANSHHPRQVLPDPSDAGRDAARYLSDTIALAAACETDPEVDPRREYVMAAQLKALLARHRRLLFTGGIAHWARLAKLIADDSVPAAPLVAPPDTERLGSLQRTVVHPSLAQQFMDACPAVANVLESRRRHPQLNAGRPPRSIDALPIVRALLRRAWRKLLAKPTDGRTGQAGHWSWASWNAFTQMLHARLLLDMRRVPNLALIDGCARTTLQAPLRESIFATLTAFPWVDPADYPDCVRLRPTVASEGARGQFVLCKAGWHGGTPEPVAFQPPPETLSASRHERDPAEQQLARDVLYRGYRFSWRPWESLTTALCCSAIGMSRGGRREPCSERFSGQLLDGVDVRKTLRAYARGSEQVWVRSSRRGQGGPSVTSAEGFPVVWIFRDDAGSVSEWSVFFEPVAWLEQYAHNCEEFRRRYADRTDRLVNLIGCGEQAEGPAGEGGSWLACAGLIIFAPLFPTTRQSCRWIEATNGLHNPLIPAAQSEEATVVGLAGHGGLQPQDSHWQELLIAGALPYGRDGITLVAPDRLTLSENLIAAAAARRKTIRRVPLAAFDDLLLERIARLSSMAGWIDKRDGEAFYVPEAERLAGEATERYRELVPPFWRSFGLER